MGRHRAPAPPLRVRVDGLRVMYRPGAVDGPGSFTCADSLLARLEAAFEAKTLVPVNGVLVEADRTTVPGVLAACHAVANRQVFVEEMPAEAEEWFALHRGQRAQSVAEPEAVPATGGHRLGRFAIRRGR